jgi:hypothetical protein
MDQTTIQRYQVGGDFYMTLAGQYGPAAANTIAAAAATGDVTKLNDALATARGDGPALPTDTAAIFANQLATDPLAAPLASLETVTSNSIIAFLKSPAVLFVVGLILFISLGGLGWIRNQLEKKK